MTLRNEMAPKIPARMRVTRRLVALALGVALLLSGVAVPAAADDYDPERAGHPLRIVAYLVHPIGVALDWLIMRPAHWLGSKEPVRTIVGHEGDN